MAACSGNVEEKTVEGTNDSEVLAPVYTSETLNDAYPSECIYTVKYGDYNIKLGTVGTNKLTGVYGTYQNDNLSFEIYRMGEKGIYTFLKIGESAAYCHAPQSETVDMIEGSDSEELFNNIINVEYLETIEYEGKNCDVVKMIAEEVDETESVVETTECKVYVDTKTKLISFVFYTDKTTGEEIKIVFEEVEEIKLPSEFETATIQEITEEDVDMQFLSAMLAVMNAL